MLFKNYIWHPFTQEKTAPPCLKIVKGKGAYLYDERGKSYLDLISSWWTTTHGHTHPFIASAIAKQALELEHVIFAGVTHPKAIELIQKLRPFLSKELSKFFFSDNGSTSVEVAMKMAFQFWANKGNKKRNLFLSFEGGYHGDTLGAMSLGQSSGFFDCFKELLYNVKTIPYPETWINDINVEEKEAKTYKALSNYLERYGDKTAAFIIEPIIQGASGMRYARPAFLKKILKLVKKYDILIIFDEVMTGFGRTGTLFAYEQIEFIPDILCLSKGLTGGFLPLALTITKPFVYEAFLDDSFKKAFVHGHSYTANPLGCAAACASLELFEKEKTFVKIKDIEAFHKQHLLSLCAEIKEAVAPRISGDIAAFNISDTKTNYTNTICQKLKPIFLDNGLLLRPLGNTIYLIPPYCITSDELKISYDIIKKILNFY
ncbi:MAG: adenosylmethionine--8-amino-7-oxononanoate transaminase [Alphaproteobacteria bacterium]